MFTELAGSSSYARAPLSTVLRLNEIFAARIYAEWKETLEQHGSVFGSIQTTSEVVSDLQAWANGMFTCMEHPTAGKI